MPSSPPSYTSATDPARQVAAQGENGGFPGPGVAQAGVISGVGMAALYCAKFAYEYYSAPEVKKEEKKWIWEN
jgi:hypothetical protein